MYRYKFTVLLEYLCSLLCAETRTGCVEKGRVQETERKSYVPLGIALSFPCDGVGGGKILGL